jgi:hypothetical protein
MAGAGARAGAEHLAVLAREPRPAGSAAEATARAYAARVLRDAGFDVRGEPFAFSTFPGRFATPIGGALTATTVLVAHWLGMMHGAPLVALITLVAGMALIGTFARLMLGDTVLVFPVLRTTSENLVATRGGPRPDVWLVAHLDSKSQPVPSALRMAGVMLLATGAVVALAASALQLAGLPYRMAWGGALALVLVGAPPVLASVVGTRSAGALDNASGVAAVLSAAAMVRPDTALGVLLPSAEELGLAGARAWVRGRQGGTALNCDGVDDEGELTIMHTRSAPPALIETLTRLAPRPPRVQYLPLGLLTDSVAFAAHGWATVTVSRGSLATLRRVHTPADTLAALRGAGIDEVATLLARAVEALA